MGRPLKTLLSDIQRKKQNNNNKLLKLLELKITSGLRLGVYYYNNYYNECFILIF